MPLIGSLLSAPYIALFFTAWIIASLWRPVAVVSVVCVLSKPTAAWRKLLIFISTIRYLVFCNDKTWKQPEDDPDSYFQQQSTAGDGDSKNIERKTIIFVRHGESSWNDTFNKGSRPVIGFVMYFVPNLIKAAFVEWYFWISGQANESWFYDSPLSQKGLEQALSIRAYLRDSTSNLEYATPKEADLIRTLIGDGGAAGAANGDGSINNKVAKKSSQLVSSNLRRAISTIVVGFQDRLAKCLNDGDDNIMVLDCLQEISRNPDTLSITPARGSVIPAWTDPKPLGRFYKDRCDTTKHTGNKPVSTNGLKRLQAFCKNAFEDIDRDAIIVGGHSLWFRSFFRTYLPYSFEHVSKKKKLINGGIVGFSLERIAVPSDNNGAKDDGNNSSSWAYRIDPKSIVVLHGGF